MIGLLVIQWLRQFVLDFCTLSMAHTMAPLEVIHQEVSEHSMTPLELIVICVGSITAYIGIGTLGTDTVVTRGICTCGICTGAGTGTPGGDGGGRTARSSKAATFAYAFRIAEPKERGSV